MATHTMQVEMKIYFKTDCITKDAFENKMRLPIKRLYTLSTLGDLSIKNKFQFLFDSHNSSYYY